MKYTVLVVEDEFEQRRAIVERVKWENAGFGLCYNRYDLEMKLTAQNGREYIYKLPEFDNRKIMSQSTSTEQLFVSLGDDIASGSYSMSFRLSESVGERLNIIKLGIKNDFLDDDGFYRISEVKVK